MPAHCGAAVPVPGGGGSGSAGVAGGQFQRFGDGEVQELDPDFVLINVMLYC
ncbi:hypothetical protein [Micromonospora sp. LOL_021]|uniref:hypothetical protein n=1 Tax=Micromonospora sp. LOL_021 TaxID=3345417 RepID=UPI003A8C4061